MMCIACSRCETCGQKMWQINTGGFVVCSNCGAIALPRDSDGNLTTEGREMLGDLVLSGFLDDTVWQVVRRDTP
jgi:hypothetical protein